jgi:hypothetical protein
LPGIYLLPDAPWAHRVSTLRTRLAAPSGPRARGARRVRGRRLSREPARAARRADRLRRARRAFPTGGGREAAAGIDRLPAAELERFVERFRAVFPA